MNNVNEKNLNEIEVGSSVDESTWVKYFIKNSNSWTLFLRNWRLQEWTPTNELLTRFNLGTWLDTDCVLYTSNKSCLILAQTSTHNLNVSLLDIQDTTNISVINEYNVWVYSDLGFTTSAGPSQLQGTLRQVLPTHSYTKEFFDSTNIQPTLALSYDNTPTTRPRWIGTVNYELEEDPNDSERIIGVTFFPASARSLLSSSRASESSNIQNLTCFYNPNTNTDKSIYYSRGSNLFKVSPIAGENISVPLNSGHTTHLISAPAVSPLKSWLLVRIRKTSDTIGEISVRSYSDLSVISNTLSGTSVNLIHQYTNVYYGRYTNFQLSQLNGTFSKLLINSNPEWTQITMHDSGPHLPSNTFSHLSYFEILDDNRLYVRTWSPNSVIYNIVDWEFATKWSQLYGPFELMNGHNKFKATQTSITPAWTSVQYFYSTLAGGNNLWTQWQEFQLNEDVEVWANATVRIKVELTGTPSNSPELTGTFTVTWSN